MSTKRGLTMTGFILLLAISTLVVSFLVPLFLRRQEDQLMRQAQAELESLRLAVTSYWRHHNNRYPPDLDSLLSAEPKVISKISIDPFHPEGAPYGYSADSQTGFFVLWTRGPRNDTKVPMVDGGKVINRGSGLVISNFPVETH